MKFLKTIQNSIYSPEFYKEVPKKSFGQSIKYFFLLILLLTVLGAATLFQDLFIKAPQEAQSFIQDTINCYPSDLEIKISKGAVSTNKEEPFFITACSSTFKTEGEENFNFAVIDTKTPFSQSKFEEYKSFVWVTKDSVVMKDQNAARLYSLTNVENFSLTKSSINTLYNQFSPYLKWIGPILLIFVFIGLFIFHIFRLIQFSITAALIWLLGKIFGQQLGYGTAYKLSLFACTLGLIVEFIVSFTSKWTGFSGFPFMFTVLTLGVVVVNLFLPKKTASS